MRRKKRYLIPICLFLMASLVFGGCSDKETPSSQEESSQNSSSSVESVESEEPSSSAAEKPSIEIVSSNGDDLLKYSTETSEDHVVFLSEIKNTSDVQLSLDTISIEVNDPDGKLLGVVNYIYAYPTVIDPGESSYICENLITGLYASMGKNVTKEECAAAKCNINYSKSSNVIPVDGEFTELELFSTDYGNIAAKGRALSHIDDTVEEAYIVIPIKDQSQKLRTVIIDQLPQPLTPDTPVAFSTQDFEWIPDIDPDSVSTDGAIICGPTKMFGS